MDFVGREAEDEVDSQLEHYVAVVDPEKKTWELIAVRKVTLRGSVRNLKPAEDEEESEDEDEEAVSLYLLHRNANALLKSLSDDC